MSSSPAAPLATFFIDKTRFIRELENRGICYARFVRPHGFGKTHFLNLLDAYYDRTQASVFANRFAGTDIGREPARNQGQYFILRFDFAGVRTLEGFQERVASGITAFFQRYPLANAADFQNTDDAPHLLLSRFFRVVHRDAAHRLLLLIDNYDWFSEALFAGDVDTFQAALRDGGVVKTFYSRIKAATRDDLVTQLFMTGVTEVSLDGVISGFNIARDISDLAIFSTMAGFTEKELRDLLHRTDALKHGNRNEDEILTHLAASCGGWSFAADAEAVIFPASACLRALDALQHTGEATASCFDADASELRRILRLAEPAFAEKIVQKVLARQPILFGGPEYEVSLTDTNQLNNNSVLTVLYRLGFLTYGQGCVLVCPNQALEAVFCQCGANSPADCEIATDARS